MSPCLRPFPIILCLLLAIATARLPYGYYQFLRIAATIWGIISPVQASAKQTPGEAKTITILISGAIAILYNPILPIHLDKDT